MTVEQLVPLIIMAFALGMDAFSVSLGMGMITLRMRQIIYIGMTIGLFHIVMPFLGMILGRFLSEKFGHIATVAGAILLIGLGFYIVYSSILESEETRSAPVGISLLVFAFSVSIDSFSVGLSLGIYGAQMVVTILMFGLISMILAWGGLLIGRHAKHMLGTYGEVLGGIILVGFGLCLLFPI
ncbi:manganese efflux pump MntP family protein [Bacillus cereus group sp. N21]|uniref:manganese efflux pump MntP n=1 Tax=Bacillus cereus group sp. N21 TaxID=2794591 RepID=UPI0018F2F489|nr:manganese efflux pump MntP family protein [Bacillus cereus group sp. N21]MBJ8026352.1 manganese efflux pump [Bacillus cereus group sp. N21]